MQGTLAKSRPGSNPHFSVETSALRAGLEPLLQRYFEAPCRIVELDREPSAYSSSFQVERLKVSIRSGAVLDVVFKNLSRHGMMEEAALAKPPFLLNPLREIEVYRTILEELGLGTPTFYGAVVDRRRDVYWLFLELIEGRELCQIGDLEPWRAAAGWLIEFHSRSSHLAKSASESVPLIRYDGDFYRTWIQRAQMFAKRETLSAPSGGRRKIDWIASRYDRVIDRLLSLPTSLIHGEYYPSNLMISKGDAGIRVCPVDWETAGVGPGLVDLAALTSGNWEEKEAMQANIVRTYRQGLKRILPSRLKGRNFFAALDCCRLHVAVQRLGWSKSWRPPPQHARDWLQEAVRLSERMEI
jgi:hypothetical protein